MLGSRLKWCKMIGLNLHQLQDYYWGGDMRKMPGRGPGNVPRPDRKFLRVLRKNQVVDAGVLTEQGNRRQLVSIAR